MTRAERIEEEYKRIVNLIGRLGQEVRHDSRKFQGMGACFKRSVDELIASGDPFAVKIVLSEDR